MKANSDLVLGLPKDSPNSPPSLLLPLILCTLGMLVDLVGSAFLIQTLGLWVEANAFVRELLAQENGWVTLVILKLVYLTLVWVGCGYSYSKSRPLGILGAWIAALGQLWFAIRVVIAYGILAAQALGL